MSALDPTVTVAERVRALAELFVQTDLLRLRIEREDEEIELGRKALHRDQVPDVPSDLHGHDLPPLRLDRIKADLVGIFHLSRPAPAEGDLLENDRELAYIEALGIRNPVRSLGSGRIAGIKKADGDPVEYGAVLFEIDRG
jgi:acetyl/propionyl-CoA carboxylase alpha subunit